MISVGHFFHWLFLQPLFARITFHVYMDIQFTTQILSSALISCCTIHMADSCVQNGVSELNRAYWVVSCNPLKSSIICLSIAIAGARWYNGTEWYAAAANPIGNSSASKKQLVTYMNAD